MTQSESALSAKRIVYVGGLAENIDNDILKSALIPFGEVLDVQMPIDYHTQKHRGFGFAEFELAEDAAAAVDNLNGSEIFGRTLRVNLAKTMVQRRPPEAITRPIWADDDWLQKYAANHSDGDDNPHLTITKIPTLPIVSDDEPDPRVYLDVQIEDIPCGRLTIELFVKIVPKTVENFRQLCIGFKTGLDKSLCYKGCLFHRIIPDFMCQTGDITKGDGSGGVSIYGERFADENFKLLHDKRGLLSMANSGQHSNNSQFFITFSSADWLDRKHVVFGKIVNGLDILNRIEACGTKTGKPRKNIIIADCGELKLN